MERRYNGHGHEAHDGTENRGVTNRSPVLLVSVGLGCHVERVIGVGRGDRRCVDVTDVDVTVWMYMQRGFGAVV